MTLRHNNRWQNIAGPKFLIATRTPILNLECAMNRSLQPLPQQTMTLTHHGQSAGRGSGGPSLRTRLRDGRGDQRPARSVVRGVSPRTRGGKGERRPAAANAAEGWPRRLCSTPRDRSGGDVTAMGGVSVADATDDIAGRPRQSVPNADGRAGYVAADVRRGVGAEARRRVGH